MNFLAILLLFICSNSNTFTEKVTWVEGKALTWDDFKAKPDASAAFVASTNSGISFSYSYSSKSGKFEYEYTVSSFFYPEQSWYKPEMVDDYILKHEQTHFDISELHARKLRKKIETANFSKNLKSEIEALYRNNEKERRTMQNSYDKETDHSKIKEKEFEWRALVAKQLKDYDRWK